MSNEIPAGEQDDYLYEYPEPHADDPTCEHGGGSGGIACQECHG